MISFIQKNLYTCLVIYIVNIIEFRIDDEGNFIPKKKHLVKADITEDSQLSMLDEKRIGMVRVLWRISSDIKLTETLKEAFPKTWRAYWETSLRQQHQLPVVLYHRLPPIE